MIARRNGDARASARRKRLRSWNPTLLRVGALALLTALMPLSIAELGELRGELAFARFWQLHRRARSLGEAREPDSLAQLLRAGAAEADLAMQYGRGNPEALRLLAAACLQWAGSSLPDPMLRLQLAERAVAAAGLAVEAAPADYELWLRLARAQAALGLWQQADACLRRAQELAPPGVELEALPAG